MFNNRVVIANKELFSKIFEKYGKNYADYSSIVNKYKSVYRSIAAWMLARDSNENAINDIVSHLDEYVRRKKLDPGKISVSLNSITINDDSSNDLESFINHVHGTFPIVKKEKAPQVNQIKLDDRIPVLTGDGIQIFKVDEAQDSKQLAGDTSWCIAYAGPNNMWQSYRINQAATFFIVWDENPPNPNQRKVALQYNEHNVQITDIKNRTGSKLTNDISFEYEGKTVTGNDIPTYLEYLKSKGVNIDAKTTNPETGQEEKILKNKPLTEEEILASDLGNIVLQNRKDMLYTVEDLKTWETGKFILKSPENYGFIKEVSPGKFNLYEKGMYVGSVKIPDEKIIEKNKFLDVFADPKIDDIETIYKSLTLQSDDFKTYLPKLIGKGWVLPNDVFDYLFNIPGGEDPIILYANTGIELPDEQVDKIITKKQIFNSYIKQQLTAYSLGHNKGKFIKYLNPDKKEDRDNVIQAINSGGDASVLPKNWVEKVPQVGLMAVEISTNLDFEDPLAIKVAIAKGFFKVYQKHPSLENTRLFLCIPEAVDKLKEVALADGYSEKLFNPPSSIFTYAGRFKMVPEEFKDLPEFTIYKNITELSRLNESQFAYKLGSPELPLDNENTLQKIMAFVLYYHKVPSHAESSETFWKYFFNNIDKFQSGAFRRINIEKRDLPYDFDYEVENEEYFDFIDDSENQKSIIEKIVSKIPARFIKDPEIEEKVKDYLGIGRPYISKLLSNKNFESAAQYINSWYDIPRDKLSVLFDEKNSVVEKLLTEIKSDSVIHILRDIGMYNLKNITNLINWYPEIRQYITYNMLFNLIQKDIMYGDQKEKVFIPILLEFYPDFFKENVERLKISEETKNFIRTKLSITKPEEPTIASVNIIVKIARKLDEKNKYKLADKISNVLGKYNV